MYNTETKNEFLKTRSSEANKKTASAILAGYEKIEEKTRKDIGEFTAEEIINAMNEVGYASQKRAVDVLRILRGYKKWYADRTGLDACSWDKIDGSMIKVADTLREEIIESISEINDLTLAVPTDQCEMAFPLVYILWYGITVDEAIELNKEDVGVSESKIAIFTDRLGKTIIDDPKAVEVIKNYARTDEVVRMKPTPQKYYKEYTGKFFCKIYTENTTQTKKPITRAYMNSTWCSFRDRYGLNESPKLPSINGVLLSGRLSRMFLEEIAKGSIGDEFIKKEFDFKYKNELSCKKMINDVRRQYKAYKEAFGK